MDTPLSCACKGLRNDATAALKGRVDQDSGLVNGTLPFPPLIASHALSGQPTTLKHMDTDRLVQSMVMRETVVQLDSFNFLSTSVAGLVGFALGAIWYAPFTFGPLWLRSNPNALERLATADRIKRDLIALISSLIQAFVLALLLAAVTRHPTLAISMVLGFLLWLGFTAAPSLADSLLSRRPLTSWATDFGPGWAIDTGHRLLVTLGIAFIIGVW